MHPSLRAEFAQSRMADLDREIRYRHLARAARPARPARSPRRGRHAAGRIAGSLVLVAALGCWLAGTDGIARAATTTASFRVPYCTTMSWTVPAGVTAAVFDVFGAAGGGFSTATADTSGGDGGYVHDALAVSPGEVLTIASGGEGGSVSQYDGPGTAPGGAGGCGGGGQGGAVQGSSSSGILTYPGAGGGGASQVSVGGAEAPSLVAAGGGGATLLGEGGAGGPQTGGSGSANAAGASAATGGSQSTGGQPGLDAILGTPSTEGATSGAAGIGGTGGSLPGDVGSFGGGGGGAGWYGGGGGAVDSGAGGSNYIAQGGYDAESDGGGNPGQGYVVVTYGTAGFPSFTGSPPDGITGHAYSYQFLSTSWPAPQYFTTDPNALPPGVTLSADGTLSGTPTAPGSYTFSVAAANPAGAAGQQVTIDIDAAPQVTTQPASQVVSAGQPVAFTAAVSGTPAPSAQWQVRGHGSSTWSNLAGATSTSLGLTASSADNGNSYRAVFTNVAGMATTSAASLKVTTAVPALTGSPAAGPVGTKVTLSGDGLPSSAAVGIRLGSATGLLLATGTVSASGTLSVTLKFPAATYGTHTLDAVVGRTVTARVTFTVEPHLTLPVKAIAPGKTARAALTGFKDHQKVTLRLASARGRKLGALTTSTAGSGTAAITIPAGTKAGTYRVYAVGSGQPTATATIRVS